MDPYKLLRRYTSEIATGLFVILLVLALLAAFIHLAFGSRRAAADVPVVALAAECQVPSLQLITPCQPRGSQPPYRRQ